MKKYEKNFYRVSSLLNGFHYAVKNILLNVLNIFFYSPHISEYPLDRIISLHMIFRKRKTQWSHIFWQLFVNNTLPHNLPSTQLLCRNAFLCGKYLSILLPGICSVSLYISRSEGIRLSPNSDTFRLSFISFWSAF